MDATDIASPVRRPAAALPAGRVETETRPGLSTRRLVRLMARTIEATGLDLSGLTVLTEAATGIYAVTPVIAAMAGARQVHAVTRASRFGSVEDVVRATRGLAAAAGVDQAIRITEGVPAEVLPKIDIATNSGHLRPLGRALIERLPAHAVIALMYEAWEFRTADVDLVACAERGVAVAGVNERHPALDVFAYLGELCARQMNQAGVSVCNSRIALLCDNDFAAPIRAGLEGLGGQVVIATSVEALPPADWDAVVVALQPAAAPRIGAAEARRLAAVAPEGVALVQFWGDVDRAAAAAHGLQVWPPEPPGPGHMAALLSDLGPEPIVRLQTGGLRAAECLRRGQAVAAGQFTQVLRPRAAARG